MSDGREGCGERLWEFGLLTALRRASRGLIRLLAVAFAVLVGSFVSIDIAGAGSAIYATSGHSYDTHAEVAPAHAALGIAATVSGTPAGVLGPSAESAGAPLRLSGELVAPSTPSTLRGDLRSPSEIFDEGFQAVGDDLDLLRHAEYESIGGGGYVSTLRSPGVAQEFGPNVYVVRAPGGIDVNDVLGTSSPYPWELEIAFPGGIPSSCIVGWTLPGGQWVPNPNFGPR